MGKQMVRIGAACKQSVSIRTIRIIRSTNPLPDYAFQSALMVKHHKTRLITGRNLPKPM